MKKLLGLVLLALAFNASAQNAQSGGNVANLGGSVPTSAFVDPGGGWSIFIGQGAGTLATASVKGFFTGVGYQVCGGAGVGMSGTIVENSCFGWSAGSLLTTGTFNTYLGVGVGRNENTGSNNTGAGVDSQGQLSGANSITSYGVGACKNGTTLSNDTCIGVNAQIGQSTTTATNNVTAGLNAFSSTSLTDASQEVMIGVNSGKLKTTGNYDLFAGYNSGSAETSGAHNVLLTPSNLTQICATGQNNLIAGYQSDCPTAGTASMLGLGSAGVYAVRGYMLARAAGNLSACGTSPSISATATDMAGTITTGSAITTCTLTFATATGNAPTCLVTSRGGTAPTYATADNATTATLTLSVAVASTAYDYWCPVH